MTAEAQLAEAQTRLSQALQKSGDLEQQCGQLQEKHDGLEDQLLTAGSQLNDLQKQLELMQGAVAGTDRDPVAKELKLAQGELRYLNDCVAQLFSWAPWSRYFKRKRKLERSKFLCLQQKSIC